MNLKSLRRLFLFTVALAATGCGTTAPVVSVNRVTDHTEFKQTFARAYTTRDSAGDYQIVLIDDPLDLPTHEQPGAPLKQQHAAPIRQILHIQMLWRPKQGTQPDSAAATNASLHWYVIGDTTAGGPSFIHYAGTAFVAVIPNGPGVEATVKRGLLKKVDERGQLKDPLEEFTLETKFDAVTDDAAARRIIADMKSAITESTVAQTGKPDHD